MGEHFLSNLVDGEPGFSPEPWYNPEGDCLVFKSEDVAVVAERVDDLLTIYLSAEDDHPVGFQLKGIQKLMEKMKASRLQLSGLCEVINDRARVSITILLWQAYDYERKTISRRQGYALAAQTACRPMEYPEIPLDTVAPA